MTEPSNRYLPRRDKDVFPPIASEHAQAIGYVVAHWSEIEETVAFIAMCLLGVEGIDGGDAVTAELTSGGRASLVRALLYATRRQDWLDLWDGLAPTFQELQAERNQVVHGTWSVVAPSHWLRRVKAPGEIKRFHGEFSTTKVKRLAERIRCLLDDLSWFAFTIIPQAAGSLHAAQGLPLLVPGHGQRARAQAQARAEKHARRDADRLRSKTLAVKSDEPKE